MSVPVWSDFLELSLKRPQYDCKRCDDKNADVRLFAKFGYFYHTSSHNKYYVRSRYPDAPFLVDTVNGILAFSDECDSIAFQLTVPDCSFVKVRKYKKRSTK